MTTIDQRVELLENQVRDLMIETMFLKESNKSLRKSMFRFELEAEENNDN